MRWKFPEKPCRKDKLVAKRLKAASKFYRFLWEIREELFDEDFQALLAESYAPRGQAPVPPALLAMVWLLQAYTGLSDRDAVDAASFDLRWQLVLGCIGEETPFGQGSLPRFRARLIDGDLDQRLVDRTVELAKKSGLFGWKNLKVALDSSPLRGAGRVEDTWNLIGRAIGNLVSAVVKNSGFERMELISKLDLQILAGKSLKSVLDIDWDEPGERSAALQRLVDDAQRLRDWMVSQAELDVEEPAIRQALTDLQRVIEQDTEPDPERPGMRIRHGTVRDRMPSLGDRDMRHGRKSKSNKFVGYKRHFGVIEGAGLIAGAIVLPANVAEHRATASLLEACRTHGEIHVVDFDRGYLGAAEIPQLDKAGVVIRCKAWPSRNHGRFTKLDFDIDLAQAKMTCPASKTVPIRTTPSGSRARFPKAACQACGLRGRCTTSKRGRTVQVHPQEDLLQRLRARNKTAEGRAELRERVVVEHRLGWLQLKQGGRARYKGTRKNTMDVRRHAALSNLMEVHRHLEQAA